MKQTAVEWLQEQLKKGINYNPLDSNSYLNEVEKVFKQAKEMEKEQIVDAVDGFPIENRNLDGEQYYNETYGKGNS